MIKKTHNGIIIVGRKEHVTKEIYCAIKSLSELCNEDFETFLCEIMNLFLEMNRESKKNDLPN